MKAIKVKAEKGTLTPLRDEFLDEFKKGRRFSSDDIYQEVSRQAASSNPEMAAYNIVVSCRKLMAQAGLPLAYLPSGVFGIPKTKDEVQYAMRRYGLAAHTIVNHAQVLKNYALAKNIMPKLYNEERVQIPSFAK